MTFFLDVDGVLNTKEQWNRMYSLNEECVRKFCAYAKKHRAKIVLSSSWKTGFVSTKNEENLPHIKCLEAMLEKYQCQISDKTPKLVGRTRDKEIERYLYYHPDEYLIIDDDVAEFSEGAKTKNLYLVRNGFGR